MGKMQVWGFSDKAKHDTNPTLFEFHGLPSGKHTKKLWKITMFNGTTHYFYGHVQ